MALNLQPLDHFFVGGIVITAIPIIIQPDLGTGVVYIAFGHASIHVRYE